MTEGESVHLSTDRPKIERDAAVTNKATGKPQMKGNNGENLLFALNIFNFTSIS